MFSKKLSRGSYACAAAIRLVLFAAVTLGYPFALYAMVRNSGCGNDTCGALALVISLITKPAFYLVFILSFIGITIRRVRDIGLPVWFAAIVPVLMLGDFTSAMAFGAPWTVGFVAGTMVRLPGHLIMALACIGFLCFARSADDSQRQGDWRWGAAGALAFGIVITASIASAVSFIREVGMWLGGDGAAKFFLYVLSYYASIGLPLLLIATFVLVLRQQRATRPV